MTNLASVHDVIAHILEIYDPPYVSVMDVHKLVYHVQQWSLVWTGSVVFREEMQAWASGPVCPDFWHDHKKEGVCELSSWEKGNPDELLGVQRVMAEQVVWFYGNPKRLRIAHNCALSPYTKARINAGLEGTLDRGSEVIVFDNQNWETL